MSEQADRVNLTGQLTAEGVECQAMRGDDGRLYTLLIDNLRGLKSGDRVHVQGERAEMSYCMQGTTVQVRLIRKIK